MNPRPRAEDATGTGAGPDGVEVVVSLTEGSGSTEPSLLVARANWPETSERVSGHAGPAGAGSRPSNPRSSLITSAKLRPSINCIA